MMEIPPSLRGFDLGRPLSIYEYSKKCGKATCRCRRGHKHGPYVRCDGYSIDGRRRATTLRGWWERAAAEAIQGRQRRRRRILQAIKHAYTGGRRGRPRVHLDHELLAALGLYRRSGKIRQLRSFPKELRWRRQYGLLDPAIRPDTVDKYVALCRHVEHEKARSCRFSLPFDELAVWATAMADDKNRQTEGK